jgi:hypothetical protein
LLLSCILLPSRDSATIARFVCWHRLHVTLFGCEHHLRATLLLSRYFISVARFVCWRHLCAMFFGCECRLLATVTFVGFFCWHRLRVFCERSLCQRFREPLVYWCHLKASWCFRGASFLLEVLSPLHLRGAPFSSEVFGLAPYILGVPLFYQRSFV